MSSNEEFTNTVFQKSWWLEAVAPGKWKYIDIEKGGQLFARFPIVMSKIGPFRLCTMPEFTQVLGPWIRSLDGKQSSKLSKEKELFTDLIDKLPSFSMFKQRFHYSVDNWLPFYWKKFQQTTRYTYVLENISDPDLVWKNMQGNIRREIKKAQKKITIEHLDDPKVMWDFHCINFDESDDKGGSYDTFKRLHSACLEHNAGQIFVARNEERKIISAMYVVWDENSAVYLLGGTIPNYKNTGAFSLMMWEAIKFTSSKTSKFDFEGSMIESIERFYRAFGGIQKPYFQITKTGFLATAFFGLKELIQSLKR